MENLNNAKLFVCFPKKINESFQNQPQKNDIALDLGKALTNSINSGNYIGATSLLANIANSITSPGEQKTVKQILIDSGVDVSASTQNIQTNIASTALSSLIPK